LKRVENVPPVSGGRMSCLFRLDEFLFQHLGSNNFLVDNIWDPILVDNIWDPTIVFSHLRRSWVPVGATWLLHTLVFAQSFSQLYTLQMLTIHLLPENAVCIFEAENS